MAIDVSRELPRILKMAVGEKASDIHIKPGQTPIFRINGALREVSTFPKFAPQDIADVARKIMNDQQIEIFREFMEVDLAYSLAGVGRFRVNVFQQRGSVAISLRLIPHVITPFDDLYLPEVLRNIAEFPRGLVLVTGATGSGKSTTIAAMIDHINTTKKRHIVTIEDPIEFLMKDKKSIISQREVGFDTTSFLKALRAALRQDPDVILVGEMRDVETITTAMQAAETGHLVMSTLHTVDVMETINRILSFYPSHQVEHVRYELSASLRAIISQRLVPRCDIKGRAPAVEVMINNSRIRGCIKNKEKTHEIIDAMEKGFYTEGMQTYDMALMRLVKSKMVAFEEAMQYATNPGDFALKIKGVSTTSGHEFDESTDQHQRQAVPKEKAKRKKPKIGDEKTEKMVIERFSK
jgi:twitching motility protein PilT